MPSVQNGPNLSVKFEQALVFATRLHAAQVRKGSGVPYIAHLLSVAGIVLDHGGTEEEAIAGLLHDAVEDQGGIPTLNEIRDEFGNVVADIVDQCSDAFVVPKPPWRERKEKYVASIAHKSRSVRLVSAADKLHNARTILNDYRDVGEALWDRFKGRKHGTKWYYRALVEAFEEQEKNNITKELRRVVEKLEEISGE